MEDRTGQLQKQQARHQELREAIRAGMEGESIPGEQVFEKLRQLVSD